MKIHDTYVFQIWVWFVCIASLFLTACPPTPLIMQASDSTLPTIELSASRESASHIVGQVTLTSTSASFEQQVCLGDILIFSATASDLDGGVENVKIEFNFSQTCRLDEDLSASTANAFTQENPASVANPGDDVLSERFTTRNWPVMPIATCESGIFFLNGRVKAVAINHHGGWQATENYLIRYSPFVSCAAGS